MLTPKLDHGRVVHQVRKLAAASSSPAEALLGLIMPYLKSVQKDANAPAVNEAVNSVLVTDEDVDALRASITDCPSFDQVGLAQRLEKHELLELRRVAALLYKRNKRWDASIALSKQDAQYRDAVETAAESGEAALAEGLLTFFVGRGDRESFAATLFTCYRLIRPDVAMELAWRARMTDHVMPFMIQYMRDTGARIAALEARSVPKDDKSGGDALGGVDAGGQLPYGYGGGGMLAIADTAYNAGAGSFGYGGMPPPPQMGGYGAPPPPQGMGGLAPPPPQQIGFSAPVAYGAPGMY